MHIPDCVLKFSIQPQNPLPLPQENIKRQSKLLKHDGKWGLIVLRSFFKTESHRKIKWVAK